MVSDKEIFKVFYIDIQGKYVTPHTTPTPRTRSTPGGHVFWRIMMAWTTLKEGYIRNISAMLYWNQSICFWQEDH